MLLFYLTKHFYHHKEINGDPDDDDNDDDDDDDDEDRSEGRGRKGERDLIY
jgi:fatty acid desaturase